MLMALVGLTYDLRSWYLANGYSQEATAEFDRDDTVDALEAAVRASGHESVRIGNARQLVERLAAGDRWDLVLNVCEGLYAPARESQVPCILDAYGIPYTFADAGVMALCLNKAWCKAVVAAAGVATPASFVVERGADARKASLPPPLFAKPLSEGTGKGIAANSIVRRLDDLEPLCTGLLERFAQPVLVETYLAGREFTVSILGTDERARVLGTLEIVLRANAEPGVYSYVNKEECEERIEYRLVTPDDPLVAASEQLALNAWRALGCRDGGRVDVRADEHDRPYFLEVNPLAGLHPHHSDLPMTATAVGMSYDALIGAILASACERLPQADGTPHARRTAL
jgi:D-alanine-D-alanine ligase